MKKLIAALFVLSFCIFYACSKETPVSADNAGTQLINDWPVNSHFCVNIRIVQHTTYDGDVEICNANFYSVDMGWSRVLNFTTVNTETNNFTYYRTVTWVQACGRTAFWNFPNNGQYSRSYNIIPDPPPNNSGSYSTEETTNFSLGTTYSYQLGISIITGEGDE